MRTILKRFFGYIKMGIKIGKILKGALGIATSILPGGGVVKGILGLAADKIPGAKPILEAVFNEAEKMFDERADIRAAYLKAQEEQNRFLLAREGRYTELKTKIEGIVRTLTRPVLTIGCVTNLIIMLYQKVEIDLIFGGICITLVGSWCSTKAFRDWRKK